MTMSRQLRRLAVVALALGSTQVLAAPDFAGTWKMDAARSDSASGATDPTIRDGMQIITRSDDELRVETIRDGNRHVARFPLANPGPPTPVGTSGDVGVGILDRWSDSELVTSTLMQINGKTMTVVESRRLSADGREMTVVTTLRIEHGYIDANPQSKPITDVYIRVAP